MKRVLLAAVFLTGGNVAAQEMDGEALYQTWCAVCHSQAVDHSPHITSLNSLPRSTFLTALNEGVMQLQGQMLSPAQREAVADFVVGDNTRPDWDWTSLACEAPIESQGAGLMQWGFANDNSRYIPAGVAGVDRASLQAPEIDWIFAYPGATRARSQPALSGDSLFVGSEDGTLYAMNRHSGCIHWTFNAGAEIRTGITLVDDLNSSGDLDLLVFGDFLGRVYGVNPQNGELVWRVRPEIHATATITAQPQYADGRVYVSLSSREFLAGSDPSYHCCTFRGSVVALDASSGETLWQSYVIPDTPQPVGLRSSGTRIIAPSGAPVWNTATIDRERNQLYVGTGENYSRPTSDTSDAIIAMDLDTGEINWVRQTLADDAWNVACNRGFSNPVNCPDPRGPDYDYGSPPVLVSDGERDILVAGQKSGWAYGMNPDNGELVWSRRVGRGGGQGGIHFGMAAAQDVVFVPMFDYGDSAAPDGTPTMPGLNALDAFTGELLWSTLAQDECDGRSFCAPGISHPPTALDGFVIAGHSDGMLRAYDAQTGEVVWQMQTDREFQAINGLPAEGGSFGGGAGPVVLDGTLYINSGYSSLRHMPGNLLMALDISR